MGQLTDNNFLNKTPRFLSSFIFLLSTLLLFVNSTVSAWWDEGHLAVAQIAYEELQPEMIHEVESYLDAVSGSFPNHSDLVFYLKTEFPRDSLPQLVEKNVDSWRQESYDIGVNFGYGNIALNESPSEQVMMEGKIVTGKQLALAGYRLADLLNDILGGKSIK